METSVIRSEKDNSSVNNVCFGCTLPIIDPCLSKVLDKLWHDRCLRCSECQVILRDKCFARDSNLYCKQDFYRIYGVQCSGCDEGIFPSDLVRRIGKKFFHMTCLKCCRCGKEVSTGDQLYILEDGTFLCKTDYENQVTKTKIKLSLKTSKVETDSDADEDHQPPTPYANGENPISDEDDEPNRRRGPRTTIKAKQLDVLKAAFLATPKPSKHIREKLAQDTGLTMRVIQVWFQNRRSKERRVKQLPVHDPVRGIRKNVNEEANEVSYPFYQNTVFPQPMEGWFGQQGFRFFSSSSINTESNGNKPDTKSKGSNNINNINKNINSSNNNTNNSNNNSNNNTQSNNNNNNNIHGNNNIHNNGNNNTHNNNNNNGHNNNNTVINNDNHDNNSNNSNISNNNNNNDNNITSKNGNSSSSNSSSNSSISSSNSSISSSSNSNGNNNHSNGNNNHSNGNNNHSNGNNNHSNGNNNHTNNDNNHSNNDSNSNGSSSKIENNNNNNNNNYSDNSNNNSENKNNTYDNISDTDTGTSHGTSHRNTDVPTDTYAQIYAQKQAQARNHTQPLQGLQVLATAE